MNHKPVGNICKTYTAKGFASRIYKELLQLNNKFKKLKKWAKHLKRHLTEEDIWMANNMFNIMSHWENANQATVRKYSTSIRIFVYSFKSTDNTKC